jgi:hypothetical protein
MIIAALFMAFTGQANANYANIKLKHGISVDIPNHWNVLEAATISNIRAHAEAIDGLNRENKETILAVNSEPQPHVAQVRISAVIPGSFTQEMLLNTTQKDLDDLKSEYWKVFSGLKKIKIINIDSVEIENVGGHNALIISYIREGMVEPSPWMVTIYEIPISTDKLIYFTISYRIKNEILLKPILKHIKDSIRL